MVDLREGSIRLNGKSELITKFEVWFSTPKGLFTSRKEAIEMMAANDWPETLIRPVPVAVGNSTYEVL